MIEGDTASDEVKISLEHGRKGKNGNWPGCTKSFVKRTEARRKLNKAAKKSRSKNRRSKK